jgi:hypothetical protein
MYYPGILLEWLRKTTKSLSKLNPEPPKYEAGVIIAQPWLSRITWYKFVGINSLRNKNITEKCVNKNSLVRIF